MRGNMDRQVNHVFNASGIFTPGESKKIASDAAREAGSSTASDIARNTSIYSYRTAELYKDVWHECANWCKENLELRDIQKIDGEMIGKWLCDKIDGGDLKSRDSFNTYASALNKLAVALEQYAERTGLEREYDFRVDLQPVREYAADCLGPSGFCGSRAYEEPAAIVEKLYGSKYELAERMAYEGGGRAHEVNLVKEHQLRGETTHPHTAEQCYCVHLDHTKGGEGRDMYISLETGHALEAYIMEHGEYYVNYDNWLNAHKEACVSCDEQYTGLHGLRWNYAQDMYSNLTSNGMSHHEALHAVSELMGHHRLYITEHYLR